ncbi:hypothetical protein ACLKA6_017215 [Drosophila palustris]
MDVGRAKREALSANNFRPVVQVPKIELSAQDIRLKALRQLFTWTGLAGSDRVWVGSFCFAIAIAIASFDNCASCQRFGLALIYATGHRPEATFPRPVFS